MGGSALGPVWAVGGGSSDAGIRSEQLENWVLWGLPIFADRLQGIWHRVDWVLWGVCRLPRHQTEVCKRPKGEPVNECRGDGVRKRQDRMVAGWRNATEETRPMWM